MPDFIPPFPPRFARTPSALTRLKLGRRNFLSIWEEAAFDYRFVATRLLARQVFICNSPDTVRQAFVTANAGFERKSPQMRHALRPLLGDGLFISDGDVWAQRRRIVAPIVHASRMAEFVPVMVETTVETRDRWDTLTPDREIDALSEMASLTAEIICRTIFGRTLGHEHAQEVVEGFSDYQRHIGQLDLLSLIGVPDWVPRPQGRRIRRSVARISAVLDDIITTYRRQATPGDPAMIRHLMDARDAETGAPLDDAALRNEAATIFMAGHETTANSLAWTWYCLSQAPEVEARLHAELDQVLAGREPTLADMPRLPYTRAIIEEVLRLYPPVPLLAREAGRDETIRDRRVPRGSLVIAVPWLLHRHRGFWDAPDAFRPERFLPDAPRPIDKYAYIPFALGPRVCAGLAFGMTESILCLATLAQRFRLRLRPGARVEPVCRLTLRPGGDGLPMTVERREFAVTATAEQVPSLPIRCPVVHA